MAIRVALNHYTQYRYDKLISLSPQVVRLRPAAHCRTPIQAYSLKITPENHFINWQQDPFGNYLARLVFPEKIKALSVEVDLIAEMVVINSFDFFIEDYAHEYPFTYEASLAQELAPYLYTEVAGSRLQEWLKGVSRQPQPTVDFLVALNQRLQKDIRYNIRMEPGVQPCEETLEKASGSCRDSAWLLAQILRHLGLASRFVSGYLIQLTSDIKPLEGPAGTKADFTDLHAWTEVYIPGAGWLGLDPTSGLFAGEGHIPLACTPEPGSAAPITGAREACEAEFYFHNNIQRIHEDPRVTKPYTEPQWQLIQALGRHIDTELEAEDVRLTMGGEPTFVAIDDMESPQWNTEALGAHKRLLAGDLIKRLRQHFAPGGLLQYSQGKWYPGEPLPRWALNCFWRRDGIAIWHHQHLLADDRQDYAYTLSQAQQFIQTLAQGLGIKPQYVIPAYEDNFYYLWQAGQLPINIDPLTADLSDDSERQRLIRLLNRGLNQPTGYVLPIRCLDSGRWQSSLWPLKRDSLFLIPGDSPMGLRLPLEALPWVVKAQREIHAEHSLFDDHPPLAEIHGEVSKRYSYWQAQPTENTDIHEQPIETVDTEVIHTALCLEVREGCLYVFLPPFTELEHYLELMASIEATAKTLNLAIIIEGYPPPMDPRLLRLSVTPDPGVIEVNIHPAHSWDELVHNTTVLYEQAHQARLGTEKFMLDGRHTGTGGGNHITLGGPTPKDSPFLRRPDVLRSLITYWQHHPSLSYLFSGLFIGPTSQAPRIDEARHESLYELEIAFQRMPEGEVAQPWLVDRLLRHLLVDLTGNTHRAEFCIDKLYSPDTASGRLGLVEMRGFEMPPHARMSLMQMLLLRALVARFWRTPYRHALVRWGSALHDRFMLPHFIRQDIKAVVEELNEWGYAVQLEWLDPFFEFRFPHYGSVRIDDLHLELRMAIEPWYVLGEEVSGSSTARYVDSSVERLQVRLSGLTDSRYVLTCNQRRVPLHNTGTHGEYVAGIRYRAWQPPSALHPTIPVDAPLIFDLIDTWNARSVGGCTYYVAHPGGRAYDDLPVNAYAAESRRISRFEHFGHTPGHIQPLPEMQKLSQFLPEGQALGPIHPPAEERNREYPYTLDLRRLRYQ